MSDDPKTGIEKSNVENKRKSHQKRWLSQDYQLNEKKRKRTERKRVEQKEARVTSINIKGGSKVKIKRKEK